jgi:hypothetical protein
VLQHASLRKNQAASPQIAGKDVLIQSNHADDWQYRLMRVPVPPSASAISMR